MADRLPFTLRRATIPANPMTDISRAIDDGSGVGENTTASLNAKAVVDILGKAASDLAFVIDIGNADKPVNIAWDITKTWDIDDRENTSAVKV